MTGNVLLAGAAAALGAGDLAQAERLCRGALSLLPADPEAWALLGQALLAAGRADEALHAFDQALAADPGAAALHDLRGDALRAGGRTPEAIAAWRQAIAADPDCVPSLVSLGAALAETGDPAGAVPLLRHAATLAEGPPAAAIWHNLANALAALGREAEADAARAEAHRLDPANPLPALAWAGRLRAAGDWQGAEAVLNALPDGTAEAAEAMFALASDRLFAHDRGNAVRLLRGVLRLKPDHALAHHDLALTLLALGEMAEGWAELEWRRIAFGIKRRVVGRRWQGQAAPGQLLLIHHEQGLATSSSSAAMPRWRRDACAWRWRRRPRCCGWPARCPASSVWCGARRAWRGFISNARS